VLDIAILGQLIVKMQNLTMPMLDAEAEL